MDLRTLLGIVRKRLGWILLAVIVGAGIGSVVSLLQDERYTATASLLPESTHIDQALSSSQSNPVTVPEREAATNLELASRDIIALRAQKRLERAGNVSAAAAVKSVDVKSHGQSNLIEVKATATTPGAASRAANVFAEEYVAFRRNADRSNIQQARRLLRVQIARLTSTRRAARRAGRSVRPLTRQVRSLQRRADDLRTLATLQTGNTVIVDRATPPSSPSSPKPVRNTVIGGLAGLIVGLGLVLTREKLDRRLRDTRELEEAFGLPVLARLPDSDALRRRFGTVHDLPPFEADAFRMLRTNLRYLEGNRDIDSVLITSPTAQDGKSTVAFNLAAAAAATRLNVLLVEAEVRRPSLARALGLPQTEGLTAVLAGEAYLADACHEIMLVHDGDGSSATTMDILMAGDPRPDATELIESERMRELIRDCRHNYDLVVIDTPPAGLVSDAIALMRDVSAVVVVGRLGKLTADQAERLREQLDTVDAPAFGVVANFTDLEEEGFDLAGYASVQRSSR
jgi:polysaccharide biosynthesis transport protein